LKAVPVDVLILNKTPLAHPQAASSTNHKQTTKASECHVIKASSSNQRSKPVAKPHAIQCTKPTPDQQWMLG
jgi:hypothetical protein